MLQVFSGAIVPRSRTPAHSGTYRSVATSRDPSDNRAPERSGLRSRTGALLRLFARVDPHGIPDTPGGRADGVTGRAIRADIGCA